MYSKNISNLEKSKNNIIEKSIEFPTDENNFKENLKYDNRRYKEYNIIDYETDIILF